MTEPYRSSEPFRWFDRLQLVFFFFFVFVDVDGMFWLFIQVLCCLLFMESLLNCFVFCVLLCSLYRMERCFC